ncbi:MAG: DNA mismatch repair endonuclease MutL [Cardiobacteriaceae bacterium]|nr:DNA mismatch repair endonuclease MutL [Cardiobacteriaceae bacterium]
MAKIFQMPPELINQITAGEVVERPASVVKELLENSLDAGATEIALEIENGGSSLISIRDNGSGIDKEDLPLAFSTHATSKIRSFEDLEQVLTLGFRGEALPSIASVSQTTLISRTQNAEHAWKIQPFIDLSVSAAAHPVGTTVEVRDLFYNTPARKKFLKSERTERQHIQQFVERLALSKDNIFITFNNQKALGGKTLEERIACILGNEFLEQAVPLFAENDMEEGKIKISGYIGLPTFNSANTDKQYCYINGRIIRDKLITHAVKQSYLDMLYHGRQPIFALWIDMPPELVDVNAHPQKYEVRFRDSRLCHDFIYAAIKGALRDVRPHHQLAIKQNNSFENNNDSAKNYSEESKNQVSILTDNFSVSKNSSDGINNTPYRHYPSQNNLSRKALNSSQLYYQWQANSLEKIVEEEEKITNRDESIAELEKPIVAEQIENKHDTMPLGRALGQIHGIFVLAENAQGLVVVDMHAAHERILYEKFKANLRGRAAVSQKLLIAQTIGINEREAIILQEYGEIFQKIGYEISVENQVLIIDAVPELIKNADHCAIISTAIAELAQFPDTVSIERLEDQILATMSCHRAIRAHRKLSLIEMNQLLRDIEETPAAGQCNHGRPTWIQMTEKELGNLFMRGK